MQRQRPAMLASVIVVLAGLITPVSYLHASADNLVPSNALDQGAEPSYRLPITIEVREADNNKPITKSLTASLLDEDGRIAGKYLQEGTLFRLEEPQRDAKLLEDYFIRIELKNQHKIVSRSIEFDHRLPSRNNMRTLYLGIKENHVDYDLISKGEEFFRSGQTDRTLAFCEHYYEQLTQMGNLDTDLAVRLRVLYAKSLAKSVSDLGYANEAKVNSVYSALLEDYDKNPAIFAKLKITRTDLILGRTQTLRSGLSPWVSDSGDSPVLEWRNRAATVNSERLLLLSDSEFNTYGRELIGASIERTAATSVSRTIARSIGLLGFVLVLEEFVFNTYHLVEEFANNSNDSAIEPSGYKRNKLRPEPIHTHIAD